MSDAIEERRQARERSIHLMTAAMAGNLAHAINLLVLREGRQPTECEVDFIDNFEGKTNREICDFCHDRNLKPSVALFGPQHV